MESHDMSIRFIGAGAGTGKTHAVVQTLVQRMLSGLSPNRIVATTFTRKAAEELEDRIRLALLGNGRADLDESLGEAWIGTVHSVCARLLERHAFAAGLPPRLHVLEPRDSESLLNRAIDEASEIWELKELEELGRRLGQLERESGVPSWRRLVRQVVDACQTNDIGASRLPAFAARSVTGLFQVLSPASSDDLDQELSRSIDGAIGMIQVTGDETKKTLEYVKRLRAALEPLRRGELPWSEWAALTKASPAVASQTAAVQVASAASRHESHPRLRRDLGQYIERVFAVAGRTLEVYRRIKEQRAFLDFADLEQRTLMLLRDNPEVRRSFGEECGLLVVDEFQDTSPIQLALFLELAGSVAETVWVGDVKQAIYGFRASDPQLVGAVVRGLPSIGGKIETPLATSWRTTPDLVRLANDLFVPAFAQALRLPAEQVRLDALAGRQTLPEPALEWLELSSGLQTVQPPKPKALSRTDYAKSLALALPAQWSGRQLLDRSGRMMDGRPGDIAVLCRTNRACKALADQLRGLGVPVKLASSGLLETPEAVFALASLRFLADAQDTLAAAEVVALAEAVEPEDWLRRRLARVNAIALGEEDRTPREPPIDSPLLKALDAARAHLIRWSPAQALDAAVEITNAQRVVSQWGPTSDRAAQRRANLEALRGMAAEYEAIIGTDPGGHCPTLPGLLRFLDEQREAGADVLAADGNLDGVFVGTYHDAKGLEWPVVVLSDLETGPRARIWDITVQRDNPDSDVSLTSPLSDRWIRLWVWPYGQQESGIPLADAVNCSDEGRRAAKTAFEEELRLLYVGMTRARERLVLVHEEGVHPAWLDVLRSSWLKPEQDPRQPPESSGRQIPWRREKRVLATQPKPSPPPMENDVSWFEESEAPIARPSGWIQPSSITSNRAAVVLSEQVYAGRIGVTGMPAEDDLGNALHAILAADWIHPDAPNRIEMIRRILVGYGMETALKAEELERQLVAFRRSISVLGRVLEVEVEVPFVHDLGNGQRVRGIVDLAVRTTDGWWIFDHKSFQGDHCEWNRQASRHLGQVGTYVDALRSKGRKVAGTCVHFPLGGGWVKLEP